MLADRLTEFGDVTWVIQQLQDVKRRQKEIRDYTKKRAQEILRESEEGGDEAR